MEAPPPRLDGWKSIAAYLGRDERTAQRWRERGLPVHFVPGGRRGTVFAFTSEVDEWLSQQPPGGHPDNGHAQDEASAPHAPAPAGPLSDAVTGPAGIPDSPGPPASPAALAPARPAWTRRHPWLTGGAVLAVMAVLAAAVAFRVASGSGADSASRIARAEVSQHGLLAWTLDGRVAFAVPLADLMPAGEAASGTSMVFNVVVNGVTTIADLDGDGSDEVIATLAYAAGRRVTSDEVRGYSADGTLRWRYRPRRHLRFGDRTFDGPWAVASQLVVPDTGGRSRIVLSVYHDIWWPSFVVSLDAEGNERLHLVHSGQLYALQRARTPAGDLVLAAGVNNEYRSAALAGIDIRAAPAVSPQADPAFSCADCGPEWLATAPAAYVLFPQTEASQRLGHPYNRVQLLGVAASGVEVGVREMQGMEGSGEIYSHYRLSPDLQPVARWMSDGYWSAHQQLEARGSLNHVVTECPERKGMSVRVWTGTGWRDVWVPTEGAPD